MTVADGLAVTHTSTVTPDQIDHLGHMNVRYYAVNARAATRSFVGPGQVVDMYTRHHREQLLDAQLEVRSGILGDTPGMTRVYHELLNASTGDIASSFVHRVRTETGFTPDAADAPGSADLADLIELPAHGRPRSIDVDATMATPTLDELRALGLAMRAEREIDTDDTGGGDRVPSSMAPFLFWGGLPVDGIEQDFVHTGPEGQDIGWATMETRVVIERLPELGTRIQSFSATTSVADKTMQTSMWVFDLANGQLLASFEVVSVLFDIGARRAMSIPDDMREEQTTQLRPELGSS